MDLPPSVGLASPSVQFDGVVPALMSFLGVLGKIHQEIFFKPLVVTSVKDGRHAPGSLHGQGKAFDYRTSDKTDAGNLVFLALVGYLASGFHVTVFDERNLPGAPHVHVEYHGD